MANTDLVARMYELFGHGVGWETSAIMCTRAAQTYLKCRRRAQTVEGTETSAASGEQARCDDAHLLTVVRYDITPQPKRH